MPFFHHGLPRSVDERIKIYAPAYLDIHWSWHWFVCLANTLGPPQKKCFFARRTKTVWRKSDFIGNRNSSKVWAKFGGRKPIHWSETAVSVEVNETLIQITAWNFSKCIQASSDVILRLAKVGHPNGTRIDFVNSYYSLFVILLYITTYLCLLVVTSIYRVTYT